MSLPTLFALILLAAAPDPARPVDAVSPDSPRAAVMQFQASAQQGRFEEAARLLELTPEQLPRGPLLARHLAATLEHSGAIEPGAVSGDADGAVNDGLPPSVDEVGRMPVGGRASEPIRMVRKPLPGGTRWLFSSATVSRIEPWYDRLDDRWIREVLPEPLLRSGPRGVLWWQWLALPVLLLLGWLFGRVFSYLARRLLHPIAARTRPTWDEELLKLLGGPLTLMGGILLVRTLDPSLALNAPAEEFLHQLLKAAVLADLFWVLLRGVDLAAQLITGSPWSKLHPGAVGLMPIGTRITKIAALSMAVIAVLSELGYPVASLLAGLGIGGLALALAAQKTVENLLGSVAISVDQPFRIGDFVKIDNQVGTVELIGLRSTRVRTPERTVVSYPNGKLADMRTESFGPRDRLMFATTVQLPMDAAPDQVRKVVAGIELLLAASPKISKVDAAAVRFTDLLPASLKVEVSAWFETTNWNEYTQLRQDALLGILEVVAKAGTRLAIPEQLVRTPETKPPSA